MKLPAIWRLVKERGIPVKRSRSKGVRYVCARQTCWANSFFACSLIKISLTKKKQKLAAYFKAAAGMCVCVGVWGCVGERNLRWHTHTHTSTHWCRHIKRFACFEAARLFFPSPLAFFAWTLRLFANWRRILKDMCVCVCVSQWCESVCVSAC